MRDVKWPHETSPFSNAFTKCNFKLTEEIPFQKLNYIQPRSHKFYFVSLLYTAETSFKGHFNNMVAAESSSSANNLSGSIFVITKNIANDANVK